MVYPKMSPCDNNNAHEQVLSKIEHEFTILVISCYNFLKQFNIWQLLFLNVLAESPVREWNVCPPPPRPLTLDDVILVRAGSSWCLVKTGTAMQMWSWMCPRAAAAYLVTSPSWRSLDTQQEMCQCGTQPHHQSNLADC